MYKTYPKYQYMPQSNNIYQNQNTKYPEAVDDRLIGGGFLGPFVLGGLTGGLVAPYFYRPYPYYQQPYPYYPPRW